MRDLRDPEALGILYTLGRRQGWSIDFIVKQKVPAYDPGPFMSAPPSEHHLAGDPIVHLLATPVNVSDGGF